MTTTVVRDSIVGDQWIYQTSQNVPVQWVIDEKTGDRTGDIITGPVRLAFDTLFELQQPSAQVANPKYGATMLFTPYADFTLFYEAYYQVCARDFADHYDAASGQYYGLHSPFRDQAEKLKFGGFTPGCVFVTSTSKFKPPVIDHLGNPIVDKAKVYPGVWAICAVNAYSYKDPRKKGVGFGLQSVMLIGDDTKFGGGAPDPNKTFGGVKGQIIAPAVAPGAAAHLRPGQPPAGAPTGAPAAGHVAPPPAGGTYAAPPAAGRPILPPPGGSPAAGYSMPGAPVGDPRGPVPAGYDSWQEYDELMG